ncbi:MAG: glycosyltransferase [Proteobacteria bacterium]|nr:glycosyltransferase [Pseudomonadota bacterium]
MKQPLEARTDGPGVESLSLVLLTKNSGPLLDDVLHGLMQCDGLDQVELVAIDSGSTDGTLDRLRAVPTLRVVEIPPQEFGHGKTRNLGVQLTTRPLVGFLVHDATPKHPDFLHRLVEPMQDPRIAGAYARQVARPQATPVERFFLDDTYGPDSRDLSLPKHRPATIQDSFFSNVASVVRREVIEAIPFREDVVMSEDAFWCRAALEAGWSVRYTADAQVLHSHHYTLGDIFRRNFDTGAGVGDLIGMRRRDMVLYEVGHLARGTADLVGRGQPAWVPYLFTHEVVRASAFAVGRNWNRLPLSWTQRMSLHSYHWKETTR